VIGPVQSRYREAVQ